MIHKEISSGNITTKRDIFQFLKPIYPSDESFENDFANRAISTKSSSKKLVKYILIKLENQLSNSNYDMEDSEITIEHILPENYTEHYKTNFEYDIDSYIYRLGNYSLLKHKDNKKAANNNFKDKLMIFKNSEFVLSNKLSNLSEWTPNNLIQRQAKLAKCAKTVWKISL